MVLDNNQVIHQIIKLIMNMTIFMAKPKHLLFPVLLIIHILEVRQFLNIIQITKTRIFPSLLYNTPIDPVVTLYLFRLWLFFLLINESDIYTRDKSVFSFPKKSSKNFSIYIHIYIRA